MFLIKSMTVSESVSKILTESKICLENMFSGELTYVDRDLLTTITIENLKHRYSIKPTTNPKKYLVQPYHRSEYIFRKYGASEIKGLDTTIDSAADSLRDLFKHMSMDFFSQVCAVDPYAKYLTSDFLLDDKNSRYLKGNLAAEVMEMNPNLNLSIIQKIIKYSPGIFDEYGILILFNPAFMEDQILTDVFKCIVSNSRRQRKKSEYGNAILVNPNTTFETADKIVKGLVDNEDFTVVRGDSYFMCSGDGEIDIISNGMPIEIDSDNDDSDNIDWDLILGNNSKTTNVRRLLDIYHIDRMTYINHSGNIYSNSLFDDDFFKDSHKIDINQDGYLLATNTSISFKFMYTNFPENCFNNLSNPNYIESDVMEALEQKSVNYIKLNPLAYMVRRLDWSLTFVTKYIINSICVLDMQKKCVSHLFINLFRNVNITPEFIIKQILPLKVFQSEHALTAISHCMNIDEEFVKSVLFPLSIRYKNLINWVQLANNRNISDEFIDLSARELLLSGNS